MGLSVGGIDLAQQGIENEFRIGLLEGLVELLVRRTGAGISPADLNGIRQETFANLQGKYPHSGIRFEPGALK